jgi:hypothetical protein
MSAERIIGGQTIAYGGFGYWKRRPAIGLVYNAPGESEGSKLSQSGGERFSAKPATAWKKAKRSTTSAMSMSQTLTAVERSGDNRSRRPLRLRSAPARNTNDHSATP